MNQATTAPATGRSVVAFLRGQLPAALMARVEAGDVPVEHALAVALRLIGPHEHQRCTTCTPMTVNHKREDVR